MCTRSPKVLHVFSTMEHLQLKLLSVFFLCLSNQNAAVLGSNLDGETGDAGSSYFYYQQPVYPKDCKEVREQCSTKNSSGVYLIQPEGSPEPFDVYCDNDENGNTWTVFQRRIDGGIIFNREWSEYKSGFGFRSAEFWLGNEKLAFLTNQKRYQLRIDLVNSVGSKFYVIYDNFHISDEASGFNLVSVGQYSGTADSFVRKCPGNVQYTQDVFIGEDQTCSVLPIDCYDIYKNGSTASGIYTILPNNWLGSPFKVYCNMGNGGGWTVFQRRVNGSVDFYRTWEEYKQGFGFLNHEFWLGNDKIHSLTNQAENQLRIDLINSHGTPYYATYKFFYVGSEDAKYRLKLGGFGGNTGNDALSFYSYVAFSTRDRDNDQTTYDYAHFHHGAWWYRYNYDSSLNGGYFESEGRSIWWDSLPGNEYNIQYTEMKIRPIVDSD